jgi:hypothetical protein
VVIACAFAVVFSGGCHKKKKHPVDAGVVEADAGAADAGSAKTADAGSADAGTVAAVNGSLIVVSGAVERDANGVWKIGLQLAPATPGSTPAPPLPSSQLSLVLTRAGAPAMTLGLRTSFEMQGIVAQGPLDNGTSGNIVPTVVEVPNDVMKLAIVSESKEIASLTKKPTSTLKIQDAKAVADHGSLAVSFKPEPKSPVSWVLYVDKSKGDWSQVASGDDTKTSATIPADSLPLDPVSLRIDATDGFDVVSTVLSAPRPAADNTPPPPPAADAGPSIVADAGG